MWVQKLLFIHFSRPLYNLKGLPPVSHTFIPSLIMCLWLSASDHTVALFPHFYFPGPVSIVALRTLPTNYLILLFQVSP